VKKGKKTPLKNEFWLKDLLWGGSGDCYRCLGGGGVLQRAGKGTGSERRSGVKKGKSGLTTTSKMPTRNWRNSKTTPGDKTQGQEVAHVDNHGRRSLENKKRKGG